RHPRPEQLVALPLSVCSDPPADPPRLDHDLPLSSLGFQALDTTHSRGQPRRNQSYDADRRTPSYPRSTMPSRRLPSPVSSTNLAGISTSVGRGTEAEAALTTARR